MGIPADLVEAIAGKRIVPFVGSGVSTGVKPALFVSWKELIERLARMIENDGGASEAARVRAIRDHVGDYPLAAEVAFQKLGAFRFNRALRAGFRVPQPADGDISVPRAIWSLRPPLVITTNYDEVLRWAGPADLTVVANDQDEELALLDAERSSDTPFLWHLHGTVQRLGTVVLAGSDYKRLYGDSSPHARNYENALFRLRSVMGTTPLLYVGFSLSDPYVLQEIKHVLDLTNRKGAPSYALMKAGAGDTSGLWSNYNIQVVEYPDHGPPLAALLAEIARQAFPPPPGPAMVGAIAAPGTGSSSGLAPVPASAALSAQPSVLPRPARVPRPALEDEYFQVLQANRRLLILGPRRGGARTLARSVVERHFGQRVTWLSPPNVPGCTAREYFRALSGEEAVDDPHKLEEWLHQRARSLGGEHLIFIQDEYGPLDHLLTLSTMLRKLLDEGRSPFVTLIAGGVTWSRLRFETLVHSVFEGSPVRHVPPLTVAEVGSALEAAGMDAASAAEVHAAIGGLPGLLEEVLVNKEIDTETIAARLSQSPAVQGVLRIRLSEDDRLRSGPRWHARWALQEMLAGRSVRKLEQVEDELQYPEVRLYYDGLVMADESLDGATVFRCDAVRVAAKQALTGVGGA